MSPAARSDHPLAPALVGVLGACVVLAIHLGRAGGDVATFVHAARPWADPTMLAANVPVVTAGYDGMFYYRLALDPFTDRVTDRGITLDLPAYRQQRILYPLLAWAASGADAGRVPLALVLVNVAGMFAIGWLGGSLARDARLHALWGSLFAAYPGFVPTLTNDLTEIVAAAFTLAALRSLRAERPIASAGALALAALARETTALLTAAVGVTRFAASPRAWPRWLPFALPALVLGAWQVTLALRWRVPPVGQSAEAFDPPLLGLLAAAWLNGERLGPGAALAWVATVGSVLAMVVIGTRALRGAARAHERAAWYAYLALATVLEANIWANEAIVRTLMELGMITCVLALGAPGRLRASLLGLELAAAAVLVAAGAP